MRKSQLLNIPSAKIITRDNNLDILELSTAEIWNYFKSYGLLFFRGFEVDRKKMQAFADQFSSRFMLNSVKETIDSLDGFADLIDNGTDARGLHREDSSIPWQPDVVCFGCAVPAAQGSETIVCDAAKVWKELSEPTQSLFLSQKIKYIHNFSAEQWKTFFGSDTTIVDVKRTLDELEGVSYSVDENQSICLEYTCSAVIKTRFDGQDAFANAIMACCGNQEVLLENGSLIPNAVIEEIKEVTDKLTQEIKWQTGDLVMIDNSRFMHGRRAIIDTRRKIYRIISYLKS